VIAMLFLSAAFAAPTHAAAESAVWRDTGSRSHDALSGIQLSRAMVGGVECFRGQAATDLDPDALLELVIDIPGQPRWSSVHLLDSRMLASSPTAISYVQVVDVPSWTLSSDRYWFLQGAIERTAGRRALRWSRLPADAWPDVRADIAASHPGAIDPPVNVGAWIFDVAPDGTAITYYVCSDAGGSMPVALQHTATARSLPDTMGALVAEARRRR
jgi:hypothetical protein